MVLVGTGVRGAVGTGVSRNQSQRSGWHWLVGAVGTNIIEQLAPAS